MSARGSRANATGRGRLRRCVRRPVEIGCELVQLVGQRAEHGGQLFGRLLGGGVHRLASRCPPTRAPCPAAVPASWPWAATSRAWLIAVVACSIAAVASAPAAPSSSAFALAVSTAPRAESTPCWTWAPRLERSIEPLSAHPASSPASRPAPARTAVRRSMRRTSWAREVTVSHGAPRQLPRGAVARVTPRRRSRPAALRRARGPRRPRCRSTPRPSGPSCRRASACAGWPARTGPRRSASPGRRACR